MSRYRLLNEKEFSEITGIPVGTLRKMRSDATRIGPPFVKLAHGVRYTLTAYEKWVEQNTVSAGDLKSCV